MLHLVRPPHAYPGGARNPRTRGQHPRAKAHSDAGGLGLSLAGLKVALVHDYLVTTGGAERVFEALAEIFPEAPIYTAIYRPKTAMPYFATREIRPLWTDRLPLNLSNYRAGFAAYALAFEAAGLAGFDLALTSSSAFAHAAGRRARVHVDYCYTPPRFVWPCGASSMAEGRLPRLAAAMAGPYLRRSDRRAARRVDAIVADSEVTRERVKTFYGRESTVIYPPISMPPLPPVQRGDYYLTVGRLVPYKRFDLAVAACSRMNRPLVVVGVGREDARLAAMAGTNVTFAGHVSEERLVELYAGARALLLPGDDDFGMTVVEANALGTPVVAARRGGYLETVVDMENGVHFDPGDVDALVAAIERFEGFRFDRETLRKSAQPYGRDKFQARISEVISEAVGAA